MPDRPPTDDPPLNKPADGSDLEIVLGEARRHQETVQSVIRAVFASTFAATLSVVVLAVVLVAMQTGNVTINARFAAVFLGAAAIGGLQVHFLWGELLNLVRYKYSVLYPRLYALRARREWINYLESIAPRSLLGMASVLLFNLVAFAYLFLVWVFYLVLPTIRVAIAANWRVPRELAVLTLFGALALVALVSGALSTLILSRLLERDMKFFLGRRHAVRPPFGPLRLVPLGDGTQFMIAEPFSVRLEQAITVPVGFVTDLASVPIIFWPIFPAWDRYGPAAVVHDYLYSLGGDKSDRREADRTFRKLMKELRVNPVTRWIIYTAVRLFGGGPFHRARERKPLETEEKILNSFREEGLGIE